MMRKVLVFGTFDIVHPGHRFFFREAKKHGDHLTVVVARDSTVLDVKGRMPRFGELARREAVASMPEVDEAVLGSQEDKYALVRDIRPDVICLGYDQAAFVCSLASKLEEYGLAASVVRLGSFQPERFKSSLLKKDHAAPVL